MNEQNTFKSIQSSPEAESIYQKWRLRLFTPLLIGTLVAGLFILIPSLISSQSLFLDAILLGIFLSIVIVAAIRSPYLIRISVFLLGIYLLGVSELRFTGIRGDGLFFFLAFIALNTILVSLLAGVLATGINIMTFGIVGWLTLAGHVGFINPNALSANLQDWLNASAGILLFAFVVILGFRSLLMEFQNAQNQAAATVEELNTERNTLGNSISEGTVQLKKVNEFGRTVSSILNPDELIARVVQMIGDEFNCYYSALYLIDTTKNWVELKDATGEAGHVLKENKHHLDIYGKNLVSTVIREGHASISSASEESAARFDHPLLSYTRSEIGLPLFAGERVIGALDLHSTNANAFNVDKIEALQMMTDQIAIALENASLFQEAENSLAELRATQRQYLQNAWSSITTDKPLEYRMGEENPTEQTTEIDIPLALRDQIIGQINMATEGEWTSEQRGIIESIATQAALALENARLVEESQATAVHEHLAVDITSKVWASPTIEGILQTTVRELGQALGASVASIELKMDRHNE